MFQLKEQMKWMYRTILWRAFIKSNEISSAAKFVDQKQNGRKMIIFSTITTKFYNEVGRFRSRIPPLRLDSQLLRIDFRLKLAGLLLGMCAMVGVRSCQCPPRWQQTLEYIYCKGCTVLDRVRSGVGRSNYRTGSCDSRPPRRVIVEPMF